MWFSTLFIILSSEVFEGFLFLPLLYTLPCSKSRTSGIQRRKTKMGSLTNGAEKGGANNMREEEEEEEGEEPILMEQTQRFCMFPIRYKQLWEMYKKAEASFWTGNNYLFNFSFFWCQSLTPWIPMFFILFILCVVKSGFMLFFSFPLSPFSNFYFGYYVNYGLGKWIMVYGKFLFAFAVCSVLLLSLIFGTS